MITKDIHPCQELLACGKQTSSLTLETYPAAQFIDRGISLRCLGKETGAATSAASCLNGFSSWTPVLLSQQAGRTVLKLQICIKDTIICIMTDRV